MLGLAAMRTPMNDVAVAILLSSVALALGACVDEPAVGADQAEISSADGSPYTPQRGSGTIDPATMQALYYGINPPRHAEKAYQVGDPSPPLHPRPTTVDQSGTIVALATTIYNRPPFGRVARFSICDLDGAPLHTLAIRTPGRIDVHDLAPGTDVLIRPETIGTMVKLLTPEQIAGATSGPRP